MKTRTTLITSLFVTPAALLSTALFAQDLERPNYTFLELDYVYATADVEADSLNAQQNADTWNIPESFDLRGSVVVADQLLLRASYYAGEGKWKSTRDVESSSYVLSAGWLAPTNDATGIDISVEYRGDNIKMDGPPTSGVDEDVEGLGLAFGVRATPFKGGEFGVRVGWYEGDFNGSIGYRINLAYNIVENFGINAFWERMDADVNDEPKLTSYELNKFGIGARVYF